MSDDFDDLVKGWLRERGATDRAALDAMVSRVATLPARRRPTGSALAAAASIVVAIGLAAFALVPRLGSGSSEPSAPVPPDPAAFAGDARLALCGATVESALDAFEMAHARDYRLHLPAMLLSPELDVDTPGFVVVFHGMHPFGVSGAAPPPGQTWPPRSLAPERHDVCVLLGSDPATAELIVYSDVDITGLTAFVVSTEPPPSVQPASPSAPASEGPPAITPQPAPAWAGDARSVLDCADPPVDLGSAASPEPDQTQADTPELALGVMIARVWTLRLPVPVTGFVETQVDGSAHLFVHRQGDRVLAAIAVSSRSDGSDGPWATTSVAGCAAAELDPATSTGALPFGRWTDADGKPVPESVLLATPDCYDGTQVSFRGRLYVRTPKGGVDPSQLETIWLDDTTLPSDAVASGYQSGSRRLYSGPDGRAIYLVDGDAVERLPHVIGDEVMRTDCN